MFQEYRTSVSWHMSVEIKTNLGCTGSDNSQIAKICAEVTDTIFSKLRFKCKCSGIPLSKAIRETLPTLLYGALCHDVMKLPPQVQKHLR